MIWSRRLPTCPGALEAVVMTMRLWRMWRVWTMTPATTTEAVVLEQALMRQAEISEKRVKDRGRVVLKVEERRYSTYFLDVICIS